jgi:hypothetical protein
MRAPIFVAMGVIVLLMATGLFVNAAGFVGGADFALLD